MDILDLNIAESHNISNIANERKFISFLDNRINDDNDMEMNENVKFTCEFCSSIFSSSKSLENHKKSAKYCLEKQGKQNDKYKCLACQKIFSNNNRLGLHQTTCIDYQVNKKIADIQKTFESEKKTLVQRVSLLEKTILKLEDTIIKKDVTIKELAEKAISKPTTTITNNNTTTNNIVNNLQIISEEHIKDHAKHLTIDHIKKGALGYSEYFLEYPLKERIACTDYSRRKIKYKNENGEIVTDPEMTTLSDLLFKSIKDRNKELTVQYANELNEKFKNANDPGQISYFMDLASKFSQQDIEVFKMFNGDKNEFFHDILRNICSKTLIQ